MEIKFKKLHPDAKAPFRANPGDAGADLYCYKSYIDKDGNLVCHTGLAFEIPEGYVGLIFPRSSQSRTNLCLANCVGVLDSGYRGEVTAKFFYKRVQPTLWPIIKMSVLFLFGKKNVEIACKRSNNLYDYTAGDRCCQLVIVRIPNTKYIEADHLSDTKRDKGGYGSSGK